MLPLYSVDARGKRMCSSVVSHTSVVITVTAVIYVIDSVLLLSHPKIEAETNGSTACSGMLTPAIHMMGAFPGYRAVTWLDLPL
jgi:hypothetical protein